ncbi:MAG: hypothetical protein ACRDNK_03100 [Solirubrobacteraceae bacterium]
MQGEYFDDPESTARPVLLLYGNDPNDAAALQRAIEALAAGDVSDVEVDALPALRPSRRLLADRAARQHKPRHDSPRRDPAGVLVRARPDRLVAGRRLLEPFTENRPHDAPDIHQYLNSDSPIDWIVATSRHW